MSSDRAIERRGFGPAVTTGDATTEQMTHITHNYYDVLLPDSKRLNALESALKHKDGSGIYWTGDGYKVVLGYGAIGHAKTLRAAIDAAMQEQSNE